MESEIKLFPAISEAVNAKLNDAPRELKQSTFGFMINRKTVNQKKVDVLLKQQEEYKAELVHKGFAPLAILPYGAWEKVCEKASLIRFEHMKADGTTHTNPKFQNYDFRSVKEGKEIIIPSGKYYPVAHAVMTLILLSIVAFSDIGQFMSGLNWYQFSLMVMGWCVVQWLVPWGIRFAYLSIKRDEIYDQQKQIIKNNHIPTTEDYFPEGKDVEEWEERSGGGIYGNSNGGGREMVSVKFVPDPTPHFEEVLEKMHREGMKVMAAAEPGAVVVTHKGRSKNYQEYLDRDPILYTIKQFESEKLVAVMAQYGKLSFEETVMEYINQEYSVENLLT